MSSSSTKSVVMNEDELPEAPDRRPASSTAESAADYRSSEPDNMTELTDLDLVPSALIVCHMDPSIFTDPEAQEEFESLFLALDKEATFIYLRNFRRSRVTFSSPELAASARVRYDGVPVCGATIRCFFVRVQKSADPSNHHLRPPAPQRMFLISPPASPPVGWEPVPESEPVVDYELLHALASRLGPVDLDKVDLRDIPLSGTHELHPASSAAPSIVVHLCDEAENQPPPDFKPQIMQTRGPPQIGRP